MTERRYGEVDLRVREARQFLDVAQTEEEMDAIVPTGGSTPRTRRPALFALGRPTSHVTWGPKTRRCFINLFFLKKKKEKSVTV